MYSIPRLPWNHYFMLQAHLAATRSTCNRGPKLLFDPNRSGVGCVLVRDKRVIASGYNGSPPGLCHCDHDGHLFVDGHCHRTLHAEINALIQCALDETSPQGAAVFCTASPCFDCAKALVRAQVSKLYVGQHYQSRYGLSDLSLEVFEQAGITVEYLVIDLAVFEHVNGGDE